MITSHDYRPDYARLDPENQICTYMYPCREVCGKPKTEHTRVFTPKKNHATEEPVPTNTAQAN